MSVPSLVIRVVCAATTLMLLSCNEKPHSATVPKPAGGEHPVTIDAPAQLESIAVGIAGSSAERIRCEVCHSIRPDKPLPTKMGDLSEFHLGLSFNHGDLACAACHSRGQPPALHLASGERVEMRDAMRLCAQCHGPQFRDYKMGSHGGMQGHWDLAQGPRTRNNCVNCHSPHAPQTAPVQPAPGPRDRFFAKGQSH